MNFNDLPVYSSVERKFPKSCYCCQYCASKSKMKDMKPKTQKAKSILKACPKLQRNAGIFGIGNGYLSKFVENDIYLIQDEEDINMIDDHLFESFKKIFARPCPKTPKHGFVESRRVKSKKEIRSLFREMIKVDPKGEIVIMPFLENATHNAILTSSGTLSIGPGHDGATSGKSSFSLPVKPGRLSNTIRKMAGITNYRNSFIEAVFIPNNKSSDDYYDTQTFYFTQVRGGPKIPKVKDFIPKMLKVKKIISPNDDLVAWEKETKKLEPGTVVYGKDHTLASHAAVHCVINDVPFITSFVPKIGQTLQPVKVAVPPFNSRDFKLGATMGINEDIEMSVSLISSATILHNWSYLRESAESSWMLGYAASHIVKILCALTLGEARHAIGKNSVYKSRVTIYREVKNGKKIQSVINKQPQIFNDFLNKNLFCSGYGGKKWSKASGMAMKIWNAMVQIQNGKKFSKKRITTLISLLNQSVNLVHNSGWLFNKILSKEALNSVAKNPNMAALRLADHFYECWVKMKSMKRPKKLKSVVLPEAA